MAETNFKEILEKIGPAIESLKSESCPLEKRIALCEKFEHFLIENYHNKTVEKAFGDDIKNKLKIVYLNLISFYKSYIDSKSVEGAQLDIKTKNKPLEYQNKLNSINMM